LSRAAVELGRDGVECGLVELAEVAALGSIGGAGVGVPVGATLPGAPRVTEIDLHARVDGELLPLPPPVWSTNARTDGPRLPNRRAISRTDSPCRHRAQISTCSAADSPQDRTHHLHTRPIRQCGSDATTPLRPPPILRRL
jgi:hypothetical protein